MNEYELIDRGIFILMLLVLMKLLNLLEKVWDNGLFINTK